MITGIAHTAYRVRSMDAALRFYCDQLGFAHSFSIEDAAGAPWIEYLKVCDGQFVELFYVKEGVDIGLNGSYLHLCLQCDDLKETVRAMEARGVSFRVQPTQGKDGNWQAWADDPDGNPIEFMQIMPDSPQANA